MPTAPAWVDHSGWCDGAQLDDSDRWTREQVGLMVLRAAGEPIDLSGVNLSGVDISGLDIPDGTEFDGADLRCATIATKVDKGLIRPFSCESCSFANANMQGAWLQGARLDDVEMSDADLSYARLRGAVWIDGNLSGAKLAHADLARASFRGPDMTNAVITGAQFSHPSRDMTTSGNGLSTKSLRRTHFEDFVSELRPPAQDT